MNECTKSCNSNESDTCHGAAAMRCEIGFADWVHAVSQRSNRSLAGATASLPGADALFRLQAAQWGVRLGNGQNGEARPDGIHTDASQSDGGNTGNNAADGCDAAHIDSCTATSHTDQTLPGNPDRLPDMRQTGGLEAMDWAQCHMPVTDALLADLRTTTDFSHARIAACLILEPKTAVLLRKLKEAGATVGVCCEPDGVDERVAAQLRAEGIAVEAKNDWTLDEYRQGALHLLDIIEPNIIIDDGASFARLTARERPHISAGLIGVAEETTSGVRAFQAMEDDGALGFPVVAVNDSILKTGFDNAYGTGETCVTTMQEVLGARWFAGKRVGVIGYGPVGRGFALRVRALGADVTICERDPATALKAVFEGFDAQNLVDTLPRLDMAVSATGVRHTITLHDMQRMHSGAAIAVIGGVPDEIALDLIPGFTRESGGPSRTIQVPDGPKLRLLAEGDGVNYTVGGGNPIEIMDLSFAVQSSAIAYLLQSHGTLPNRVIRLDSQSDQRIARIALATRGQSASEPEDDTGSDWRVTRFDTV